MTREESMMLFIQMATETASGLFAYNTSGEVSADLFEHLAALPAGTIDIRADALLIALHDLSKKEEAHRRVAEGQAKDAAH